MDPRWSWWWLKGADDSMAWRSSQLNSVCPQGISSHRHLTWIAGSPWCQPPKETAQQLGLPMIIDHLNPLVGCSWLWLLVDMSSQGYATLDMSSQWKTSSLSLPGHRHHARMMSCMASSRWKKISVSRLPAASWGSFKAVLGAAEMKSFSPFFHFFSLSPRFFSWHVCSSPGCSCVSDCVVLAGHRNYLFL